MSFYKGFKITIARSVLVNIFALHVYENTRRIAYKYLWLKWNKKKSIINSHQRIYLFFIKMINEEFNDKDAFEDMVNFNFTIRNFHFIIKMFIWKKEVQEKHKQLL